MRLSQWLVGSLEPVAPNAGAQRAVGLVEGSCYVAVGRRGISKVYFFHDTMQETSQV